MKYHQTWMMVWMAHWLSFRGQKQRSLCTFSPADIGCSLRWVIWQNTTLKPSLTQPMHDWIMSKGSPGPSSIKVGREVFVETLHAYNHINDTWYSQISGLWSLMLAPYNALDKFSFITQVAVLSKMSAIATFISMVSFLLVWCLHLTPANCHAIA